MLRCEFRERRTKKQFDLSALEVRARGDQLTLNRIKYCAYFDVKKYSDLIWIYGMMSTGKFIAFHDRIDSIETYIGISSTLQLIQISGTGSFTKWNEGLMEANPFRNANKYVQMLKRPSIC